MMRISSDSLRFWTHEGSRGLSESGHLGARLLLVWVLLAVVIFETIGSSGTAMAMIEGPSTPAEIERLPQYCMVQEFVWMNHLEDKQRQRLASVREDLWRYWASILGRDNYRHLHHYCWGLSNMKRAMEPDDGQDEKYDLHRRFNLKNAVGNFDYVLKRTSTDMLIRPEILRNKSLCLMMEVKYKYGDAASKYENAKDALVEALQLRPDYEAAYFDLTDLLLKLGNKSEAIRVLKLAKQRVPASLTIQRRLIRLSGEVEGGD